MQTNHLLCHGLKFILALQNEFITQMKFPKRDSVQVMHSIAWTCAIHVRTAEFVSLCSFKYFSTLTRTLEHLVNIFGETSCLLMSHHALEYLVTTRCNILYISALIGTPCENKCQKVQEHNACKISSAHLLTVTLWCYQLQQLNRDQHREFCTRYVPSLRTLASGQHLLAAWPIRMCNGDS